MAQAVHVTPRRVTELRVKGGKMNQFLLTASRKRLLTSVAITTAVFAFALASPASATLLVEEVGGSTGTLIVNNACTNEDDGPALTLTGCLNNDHDQDVLFTGDENIIFDSGGGQAVVVGEDGTYTSLIIDIVDLDIGVLILNINSELDGTVYFQTSLGDISALFDLDDDGENFFKLTMDPAVDWVQFIAGGDYIEDSKQWRVALGDDEDPDPGPDPVPEPGTLAVVGAALAGWWALGRRRRAKA
jgi:hypothetical protein